MKKKLWEVTITAGLVVPVIAATEEDALGIAADNTYLGDAEHIESKATECCNDKNTREQLKRHYGEIYE